MVISSGAPQKSVHIIGVSIPRSGHNFVVRMLQALLPLDLFYCEFYDVRGCCQSFPCARRGALPVTFQKTHDFELNVPTDVPGALYLILYRVPVPAALSARELYADDYGDEIGADRGEYAVWLGRTAEYYVTFAERWIQQRPARSLLLDYDDLAREPAAALRQVLEAAGLAADEQTIVSAVQKTVPYGGLFGERAYVPRSIEKSKYLDRELLAAYESIIVDHLPGLAAQRVFAPVAYRDTLTGGVFEALRAARVDHTDRAIGLLDRLVEAAPGNALLHFERASLLQTQRRFAEARDALHEASTLFPTHRPILEASVTVSLAAGDPAAIVEPLERLDAISEPTLIRRLRLALARTHSGDETAADAVLAEVQHDLPDDADVWRIVGEIRRLRAEMDDALAAIETALRIAPLNGELYAYHGDLLLALERPRDAVAALRAALLIDSRQRGWWQMLVAAHRAAGDAEGARAALAEALEQIPGDQELQAGLEALRREAPPARSTPRRTGRNPVRRQRESVGPAAASRRQQQTIRRLLRERDDARRLGRDQRNAADRLEIRLSQVQAALGVAERRLYETEVTKQRQLEESWEQTHKLDAALAEKEAAMQESWAQTRALDAALQEKEAAMQEAWAQTRALDAALQEKEASMQAAWTQAQRLDERRKQLRAMVDELTAQLRDQPASEA